jgi:hypothetical protein
MGSTRPPTARHVPAGVGPDFSDNFGFYELHVNHIPRRRKNDLAFRTWSGREARQRQGAHADSDRVEPPLVASLRKRPTIRTTTSALRHSPYLRVTAGKGGGTYLVVMVTISSQDEKWSEGMALPNTNRWTNHVYYQ